MKTIFQIVCLTLFTSFAMAKTIDLNCRNNINFQNDLIVHIDGANAVLNFKVHPVTGKPAIVTAVNQPENSLGFTRFVATTEGYELEINSLLLLDRDDPKALVSALSMYDAVDFSVSHSFTCIYPEND